MDWALHDQNKEWVSPRVVFRSYTARPYAATTETYQRFFYPLTSEGYAKLPPQALRI